MENTPEFQPRAGNGNVLFTIAGSSVCNSRCASVALVLTDRNWGVSTPVLPACSAAPTGPVCIERDDRVWLTPLMSGWPVKRRPGLSG
jgi:hypothetical protein